MKYLTTLLQLFSGLQSRVCVGLDPDSAKMPEPYRDSAAGYLMWAKAIVDATCMYTPVYKPNFGFWMAMGAEEQLRELIMYIHIKDRLVILDIKAGDIGNTAMFYAKAVFDRYGADAVTLNPYLGLDTLGPWLAWGSRGLYVLCHTSNPGAAMFQERELIGDPGRIFKLYEEVARGVHDLSGHEFATVGLVMGATYPQQIAELRLQSPSNIPLLIPGIGKQGGDLEATVKAAAAYPFLINAGSADVFASSGEDFAQAAGEAVDHLRLKINAALEAAA